MLCRDKISLNDIAMTSTQKLIRSVLDMGVNLQEVWPFQRDIFGRGLLSRPQKRSLDGSSNLTLWLWEVRLATTASYNYNHICTSFQNVENLIPSPKQGFNMLVKSYHCFGGNMYTLALLSARKSLLSLETKCNGWNALTGWQLHQEMQSLSLSPEGFPSRS